MYKVLVSHPAKQGNVYQRPLAVQQSGLPVCFLTGLYYKPDEFPYSMVKWLPESKQATIIKILNKRRLTELNPQVVTSLYGPWLELAVRPFLYVPWLELAVKPYTVYRTWNAIHDKLAARWLSHSYNPEIPTIIHGFQGSFLRTIRAAKRRGIPTLLEITLPPCANPIVSEERRRLGLKLGAKQPWPEDLQEIQEADYIMAQSWFTINYLLEQGKAPDRIIHLPMGVDIRKFSPQPSKVADEHPFRVLFVGQLSIRKGLHLLLEAWKQLSLPNAELILVGQVTNKEIEPILQAYKGLYTQLDFVSNEKLVETFQTSDLFVFPSLAEGGCSVVNEALASGLPCVISKNAGSSVQDSVEGYVVPVGNIEAMKNRILYLYQNPQLREEMGRAARKKAEHLSWDTFQPRLLSMYEYILYNRPESNGEVLNLEFL